MPHRIAKERLAQMNCADIVPLNFYFKGMDCWLKPGNGDG